MQGRGGGWSVQGEPSCAAGPLTRRLLSEALEVILVQLELVVPAREVGGQRALREERAAELRVQRRAERGRTGGQRRVVEREPKVRRQLARPKLQTHQAEEHLDERQQARARAARAARRRRADHVDAPLGVRARGAAHVVLRFAELRRLRDLKRQALVAPPSICTGSRIACATQL